MLSPGSRGARAILGGEARAEFSGPCVEFRQIHRGMTVRRTQNIIGSRGRVTIAGSWLSQRQWNVCNSRWGVVTLTYANGRLDNKIMFA